MNVYVLCEGQTEESFCKEVLYNQFVNQNVYIIPILCATKRSSVKKYAGGVSTFAKIKDELLLLCRQHKNEYITAMFDCYGLPKDTPGLEIQENDPYQKVLQIEKAVNDEISQPNCFFWLTLHEFEGLLFSNPAAFSAIASDREVAALQSIRDSVASPELIDNGRDSSPSKRLYRIVPNYAKVLHGIELIRVIGMDAIQKQCPHFDAWIRRIQSLSAAPGRTHKIP
jgi:hypothetical protein